MMEKVPHAVGHLLRNVKPGLEKTLYFDEAFGHVPETIRVTSAAFRDHDAIPVRYTHDGHEISPPLAWTRVPSETEMLILVVEDADSPTPHPLTHALVLDLPPRDGELIEGGLISPGGSGETHALGKNSFRKAQYLPPDPPPGHGPHRYVFQLFALDQLLTFENPPSKSELKSAMEDHVVAKGMLIGTYERP